MKATVSKYLPGTTLRISLSILLLLLNSRDGVIIILYAVADMIVTPENHNGSRGVFGSNSIEDRVPVCCLIPNGHMSNQYAKVSDFLPGQAYK